MKIKTKKRFKGFGWDFEFPNSRVLVLGTGKSRT
jgi:hypothetical protein